MGAPRELRLPLPSRWPAWAVATSVALHLVALVGLVALFQPARERTARPLLVGLLQPVNSSAREIMLEAPRPDAEAFPSEAAGAVDPTGPTGRHTDAPSISGTERFGAIADSAPTWRAPAVEGRSTWPAFASGLLWDRRPIPPVMLSRTHAERTDSAAKAIINQYLDSLAALPGGGRLLPPTWKATIGGQEYGLDGNYLTVAGLKIPALVLGLIPLPAGGNESEALDKAGWMRAEDYQLAMPRDAAAADQREQAKAIRERMAAEQELRRKQREGAVER